MQRRGASQQPVKGQRRLGSKARKATTARVSAANLQEKLAQRTRELDEALQQQTATSEVLSIIRRSPADAQPVFDAIVESAARLCGAIFSVVYLYEDEHVRIAATKNFTPEAAPQLHKLQQLKRPDRSHLSGRAILDRAIVHVPDVLNDPEYSREFALAGGWRAVLAVPLLRDGIPVGALSVAKTEPKPFSDRQIQLLQTFVDQALIAIENVRLFEAEQQRTRELSESLEQQTATSEVLKVISSSPGELEPVFQAMLENARRICEAEFGVLYRCEGDALRAVAMHGAPQAFVEERRRNPLIRPPPQTTLGRVMATKQPAQIADIVNEPHYFDAPSGYSAVLLTKLSGARTVLAVPMLKENELIGAIVIYRTEVRPFSDKQIEVVKNFAAQAVIAIENVRLLNELRESLQQQTATADVLKVISRSTFDLQTVLNTLVESAARLCEADRVSIYQLKDDAFQQMASRGFSDAYRQFMALHPLAKDRGTLVGRTMIEGRTVQIEDALADPELKNREAQKIGQFRTMLGVPLMREGISIGVLTLTRLTVRPFTSRQIELVEAFADQAVIAIENTRLLNELRERTDDLSESLEQQTATSEVLKVISSSPGELEPVFNAMLGNAVRICGAKFGNLWLREGDAFRISAMYGAPPAYADYLHRNPIFHPFPGTALGRIFSTQQAVQIPDARMEDAYAEGSPLHVGTIALARARTIIAVPLLRDGELIGAMVIFRQEVRPFTEKQVELVRNFAAQAVIAIENTRLLNELRQRTDDLSESLDQQTATSEVLQVISRSPGELAPVYKAMLENATRICQASYGDLFLRDGTGFRAAATHNVPTAYAEERQLNALIEPIPIDPLARLAKTKQRVHISDARTEAAYKKRFAPFVAAVELGGVRTLLLTPLLREGELIGAFAIFRQEVRPFTAKQIELADNFAAQAVIAIENTRLLSELRESLQQQTATADVLKVISRSTFDLQTVLDTLVESATRLCEADMASINREKGTAYQQVASYGQSPEFQAYMATHPIPAGRGSVVGRTVMQGGIVHIPDVLADPDFKMTGAAEVGGIHTMLGVPLLREGTPIGVIVLQRKAVRPFTDKQIELVETFADQAVIAIENVRLFESVEARTRELAKSLENLRTTQDRLVQTQKLASLGQLTAGIAHEIKNPLNFVNNFSGVSAELIDELQEALKDVNLNEKRRKEINELTNTLRGNLDKVVQHGKRADAIVKNMLLHSREGSGEHRVVDINALVEESLNLAYHGARAEKQGFTITLERSLDPAAGAADIFPQDITRALLNLILNGFYAATKRKAEVNGDYEPTLTAATKNLGDRVEISIRDNGIGIPPEVKEKIFNPFFTTKPAGEGTGLGLSISHDIIVKQHGGSIEVETQPGEFTEIKIILPRAALLVTERT